MLGILSGIMVIGNLGSFLIRSTSYRAGVVSRSRSSVGVGVGFGFGFIVGLVLVVVGYVGLLLGKVIRSAISRQREFLADASAVQFTRNSDGIAQALNKIRHASYGSFVNNALAGEMSHFFFGDVSLSSSVRGFASNWLATHPPIEERILRISSHFDLKSVPASIDNVVLKRPKNNSNVNSIDYVSGLVGADVTDRLLVNTNPALTENAAYKVTNNSSVTLAQTKNQTASIEFVVNSIGSLNSG